MVKSASEILVTPVEVTKIQPSAEELALRLIMVLQVQNGGAPLNGTTQLDGSVTLENEMGEVVARVLPDGTAIINLDGEETRVCLTDLPEEPAVAEASKDKTESGMSEDDIWASLDDFLQDDCNPFEQSCQWDDAQQTQNNSKPFSTSSESYTAKSQQGSGSTSTSTSSTVPQVEHKDSTAANTAGQAPKKPGDAAPVLASNPSVADGTEAPAIGGDPNLAPASMPPAPEAAPVPAAQPALSAVVSTADANPDSQEQLRNQQAAETRSYPDVSTLIDRVAGKVVRFVEAIINGDEAAPRHDRGDHGARAAHASHLGASSDAAAKLQPLATSDPMTGREGRPASADHSVALSAVAKPIVHFPSHADDADGFPMGQVIKALLMDMANDPLAIACATSAAGLFQLPPFTFALGNGLSAIAALLEQRQHERIQPMVTAQRGHGEERGQHDEQQQGRNGQQQPDPYASEVA